jgi:hypothetical protein
MGKSLLRFLTLAKNNLLIFRNEPIKSNPKDFTVYSLEKKELRIKVLVVDPHLDSAALRALTIGIHSSICNELAACNHIFI